MLSLLGTIPLVLTLIAGQALILPDPATYEYLGMQVGQCQTQVVFVEYYNRPGTNPEMAELIIYRDEQSIFLMLEFTNDSSTGPAAAYLMLSGQPPEKLPFEALKMRYPTPCAMLARPA